MPAYLGEREATIKAWFGDDLETTTSIELTVERDFSQGRTDARGTSMHSLLIKAACPARSRFSGDSTAARRTTPPSRCG